MLAGLIQAPSRTNPIRWPERARTRRNIVLALMRENGYITEQQYLDAAAPPLTVARGGAESADAPYFVDLVNDELQDEFQTHDFQDRSYRVYTTLDMDLQRDAAEAVRIGMKEVDDQVRQQGRFRRTKPPEAQVALVALDTQTAEIKALVGGRNYGVSQLNRILAKRQPGSSFKPFVYAAALETALGENSKPITSLTTLPDEPTTFWFDDKPYSPSNFKDEYHGTVTLRQAIAHSMNVPTVRLAEMIGYDKVVDLAKRAGMNLNIQPTPAVALGAYEVTPIEIAGAYTVFADQGVYVKPNWIKLIRDEKGSVVHTYRPQQRTQVGVAEAERPVQVRVVRDHGRWVAGVVDQDLLGGDGHATRVAERFDVELARRAHERHQVERSRGPARSSRKLNSEQGFVACCRSELETGFQSLIVVSYWMPGSPQTHAASAISRKRWRARNVSIGASTTTVRVVQSPSATTARM